jgi:pilus assembly protein CpaC
MSDRRLLRLFCGMVLLATALSPQAARADDAAEPAAEHVVISPIEPMAKPAVRPAHQRRDTPKPAAQPELPLLSVRAESPAPVEATAAPVVQPPLPEPTTVAAVRTVEPIETFEQATPPVVRKIVQAPVVPMPAAKSPIVRAAVAVEAPLAGRVVPRVEAPARIERAADPVARSMTLETNKSRVIRLARPARDVLVANPAIADVVMRSTDTAFIIGRRVGETTVYFFDGEGRQIDGVDLNVTFDSVGIKAALQRMIPSEHIEVATANQSLVLTGAVASPQVAENARNIARQFVADDAAIVNMLSIRDKNQVMLRVRVSEMSRQVVKELGITPSSNFSVGGTRFTLTGTQTSFISAPFAALNAVIPLGGAMSLTALLRALESNGLVKTLAEPNLTAVSGETASFLVGGQFPVPSPQPTGGGGQTITVVYKDFGVRLTFTPVVLSGGLINLKVATEVSQLSTQGQINANGFTIPGLTMRRAETTVELPSGGSIAIAGLLQNDIQNTIQGFPLLKDVPVLGMLFSSKQFQRNESDLVIAVTPLLVKPIDPNLLAMPTDGFGPASDFNMYVMGKLHANYTKPTTDALRAPRSPHGYILE